MSTESEKKSTKQIRKAKRRRRRRKVAKAIQAKAAQDASNSTCAYDEEKTKKLSSGVKPLPKRVMSRIQKNIKAKRRSASRNTI